MLINDFDGALKTAEEAFWNAYLASCDVLPIAPFVRVSIAGNPQIADRLLQLYLDGKKTAGSGLVKDYEMAGDRLPEIGDFWIVLDSTHNPRCIVQTVAVQTHRFKDVPEAIALAEGEGSDENGDMLQYWRDEHRIFFAPFLKQLGIDELDEAKIITEFFEVVFPGPK